MNYKTLFYYLSAGVLIFAIYGLLVLSSQNLVVFDTLREEGNMYSFIKQQSLEVTDWNMYVSTSVLFLITDLDPFYIHYLGGIFLILLTGVFFFLISKELSKNNHLSLLFTILFLAGSWIISSAFYFRLQTFALFWYMAFFYVSIKAFDSKKWLPYFFITFIIVLIAVNAHKTTKLLPFLFVAFWIFYFLKNKKKLKHFLFLILSVIILGILTFKSYQDFFSFYLVYGEQLDPNAFGQSALELSNFFVNFGLFLKAVTVGLIFTLLNGLIKDRKVEFNKNAFIFLFSALIFAVFFTFSYILPYLGLFSVNVLRFEVFMYPFILIIILFSLRQDPRNGKIWKFSIILVVSCLIITYFPIDLSETKKVTATKSYFDELKSLKFEKGDVLITPFTSSAAIYASLDSLQDYSPYNSVIVSGYHSYGSDNEIIALSRDLFYSANSTVLSENLCKLILREKEKISALPSLPQFFLPNSSEKDKIIETFESPNRILIVISIFDQMARPNILSNDQEINGWWNYRTIPDIDYVGFSKFDNLKRIYESENVIIFEFNGECDFE